jgi:TonB family C-terminal domain
MIIYMIKASMALILFYGVYRLFLGMDTFFRWKRVLLLSILFFSVIYPLWTITIAMVESFGLSPSTVNIIPEYILNEVTVYAQGQQSTGVSTINILLIVYAMGVALLSIRMLIELISVSGIIIRSEKTILQGKRVYINHKIKTPFSFFKWIVINPDNHTENEIKEILLHEETHVKGIHTLDTLISELFCIAFWFNPFVWLIKREIRINLEYLADRSVINSGCDSQHYQFHLLRLTYHKAAATLTNNFNVSPLKQRILMMNKNRTHLFGLTKYTFFIPIAAMLLFFNCQKETTQNDQQANEETEIPPPPDPSVLSEEDFKPIPTATVEGAPVEKALTPPPISKTDEKGAPIPPPVLKYNEDGSLHVYERTGQMPQFPGGEAALYQWLNNNLVYPAAAAERGVQGTVTLRFVVTDTGDIGEVQILRGVDDMLNAEAMRVVKKLPKFIPGQQDGVTVAVWFTLPVRFRLQTN